LIVDDHDGFRAFARGMLEAAGFTVAEAADGAEAAEAARTMRSGLVLLDTQLRTPTASRWPGGWPPPRPGPGSGRGAGLDPRGVADLPLQRAQRLFGCLALGEPLVVIRAPSLCRWPTWVIAAIWMAWMSRRFPRLLSR
jgi:CheY-like chemotaxis protein